MGSTSKSPASELRILSKAAQPLWFLLHMLRFTCTSLIHEATQCGWAFLYCKEAGWSGIRDLREASVLLRGRGSDLRQAPSAAILPRTIVINIESCSMNF